MRNALVCLSDGIFSMECTVIRRLWIGCFILWFVGVFTWGDFSEKNFRHVTRRGIASFTLWTAASGRNRGITGAQSGPKERGGPHTQRPTPHVPGTVIGAASHRYPEFHGRCRRDEESSTTLWCLLARFSRLFPPALSGSDVRLKETGGKRRKLVFPERLRGTLRCPQPAA